MITGRLASTAARGTALPLLLVATSGFAQLTICGQTPDGPAIAGALRAIRASVDPCGESAELAAMLATLERCARRGITGSAPTGRRTETSSTARSVPILGPSPGIRSSALSWSLPATTTPGAACSATPLPLWSTSSRMRRRTARASIPGSTSSRLSAWRTSTGEPPACVSATGTVTSLSPPTWSEPVRRADARARRAQTWRHPRPSSPSWFLRLPK